MLPEDQPRSPAPALPGRGREVNRRIAGSDLQRLVAQVRLVRRVYGVGALSTYVLAAVLAASVREPGTALAPILGLMTLLCALVSVQVVGAMLLSWAPKAWSLGLAGLQSAFYLIWIMLGEASGTHVIWLLLFWLAVPAMGRADAFKAKHFDLYQGQLLAVGRGEAAGPAPKPWLRLLQAFVLSLAPLLIASVLLS